MKVRGSGLSLSALPVPGILTGAWVHPGRAGMRLELTTAPGASKHLSALDEVVDGAFDLWSRVWLACACPRCYIQAGSSHLEQTRDGPVRAGRRYVPSS